MLKIHHRIPLTHYTPVFDYPRRLRPMKLLLPCSCFLQILLIWLLSLCESVAADVVAVRADNYLQAMNTTSSAVCSKPDNYTNNNHYTNALLTKLILYREKAQDKDLEDANSIAKYIVQSAGVDTSFGGLFGAPTLTGGLGKPLDKETLDSLSQMLYDALPEDPTQPWCDISYTNIYLMHTANLITLGEALESYGSKASAAAEAGYKFFSDWLTYTSDIGGLHEFDSPTYTAVQMNGLYIIFLYAKRASARESAKDVLDYLWISAGANWFALGQMQAGPRSRDYDYLFGKGLFTSQLYLAGITNDKEDAVYACEYKDVHCEALVCPWNMEMSTDLVLTCIGSGLQAVFAYLAMVDVGNNYAYRIPMKALELSRSGNKLITKRWQEGDAGDYHLYVSRHYSLGLISDDYDTNIHDPYIPYPPNAHDKIFALSLPSYQMPQSNPLPVMCFTPDWRRTDVYGKDLYYAGRPVHLRMRPTAAMALDGDEGNLTTVAVFVLAIDPTLNETEGWSPDHADHLALNTIIPFTADEAFRVRFNETDVTDQIDMTQDFQLNEVSSDESLVTIFGKGAAITVRIFYADSCGQEVQKSTTTIRGDSGDGGGIKYNAIRLETLLFDSKDGSEDVREVCKGDGYLKIGLIIAAREINTEDEAIMLESFVKDASAIMDTTGDSAVVDVQIGSLHFELSRNMTGYSEAMQGAINYRKVNGVDILPVAGSDFFVNGEKIAWLHS